jgi:hypothetical protein
MPYLFKPSDSGCPCVIQKIIEDVGDQLKGMSDRLQLQEGGMK